MKKVNLRQVLRKLGPRGTLGTCLIGLVVVAAVFAPLLAPHDPIEQNLRERLTPPVWQERGEWRHILGCDALGRDILSRAIFGARISIIIGLLGVAVSILLGVPLGLVAGYYGGKADRLIGIMVELQLGVPYFLLAVALMVALGPGLLNMILVLGISRWAIFCRIARGEVLALKKREYIEAAKAVGASDLRIIYRHILANIVSPLVVVGTFGIADAMLAEAGLSFLGFGLPPEIASWGTMVSEGAAYLSTAWWLPVIPGTLIALFALCVNWLGDGIRDYINPKAWIGSWINS